MILEEAIQKAESERGEIISIRDCGDRWSFGFLVDKGKIGGAPLFVFKDDGHIEYFLCTLDNLELLRKGRPIPIPN